MSTLPNPHEKGHTPFAILSHAMTYVYEKGRNTAQNFAEKGLKSFTEYAEAEGYRDAWMVLYNRLTLLPDTRKRRTLIRTSKTYYVVQD